MTYPLVEVLWRDAFFDFDQKQEEPDREDYIVSTIGHLIGRDETWVHLAAEVLPDGDGFRAVTHIPVSIVETTNYLRRQQ